MSEPATPTTIHPLRRTTIPIYAITYGGIHNGEKSAPPTVIRRGEIEFPGGINPNKRMTTAVIIKPVLR